MSTYRWHTDDISVHTTDIRMAYRVRIDEIWVHTNNMQITCEWNIEPYKIFGAFAFICSLFNQRDYA